MQIVSDEGATMLLAEPGSRLRRSTASHPGLEIKAHSSWK